MATNQLNTGLYSDEGAANAQPSAPSLDAPPAYNPEANGSGGQQLQFDHPQQVVYVQQPATGQPVQYVPAQQGQYVQYVEQQQPKTVVVAAQRAPRPKVVQSKPTKRIPQRLYCTKCQKVYHHEICQITY